MQVFLDSGDFGLKYISMKRDRFITHEIQKKNERQKTLFHEVHRAMVEKWAGHKSEIEINRISFYVTEQMLNEYNGINGARIISKWVNHGAFDKLSKNRYAQMVSLFQNEDDKIIGIPVVSSIEIVKGREAKRCLFILSPDLAPYFFREKKEDNKTSHLLYVALTRSLDHITILVMKEVENKYSREKILKHFRTLSTCE